MPCINKDNLLYVKTYSLHDKEIVKINSNVGVLSKEFVDYDFYYVQFSTVDSFKMFSITEIVPQDVLHLIRNGKVFLVLDNSLEYFLESADGIYQDIVMRHNIPAQQIIFMSAVPTMHEYVKALALKLNLPEIKVDWFSLFEATGIDASLNSTASPLENRNYDKKFLNLNRRWRLHRPLLLTLLRSRKLLDQGYISFAPSDDGMNWSRAYERMLGHYAHHEKIRKILIDNRSITEMDPMYLDTGDLVTNRAEHQVSINDYYHQTYFSVINETTYHEGVPFLSEKIFKAVGLGHPFIMVTAPNSLQYLKELGYRTYAPYINEEYDGILDDGDRMLAIVEEIERLTKMDQTELSKWLDGVKSIAQYNRNILVNKQYKDLIRNMNY